MQRHVDPPERGAAVARAPSELSGLLSGLVGVVAFGLTLPMTHIALAGFDRYFVGIGRAILAALLAAVVLIVTRQKLPPRKYWRGLAIVSGCVAFGFPIFATAAMEYASSAHGAVILAILPLATAMAGAVMAGERPSLGFWLAGVAGSLLVLAFAIIEAHGFTLEHADLLLVGSVIFAAIGYAQSGILTRDLGGWQVISWALVFGLPGLILCTWLLTGPINWHAPLSAWLAFLYVALVSQYIGFFFWNRGLALAGVAKTGQLQLLQPFVTLAGSMALLGEDVGLRHAGFALAVVAIVTIGRRLRVERPTGR
ncbi:MULTISPECIES: DMT family transporter [Rhodomicrobium]|uniref:DMT family transporter n=1 Tax=Rhodomicrobium TaxID=1068 RepID=UPI000B4ACA8E|nr:MULTISPECIES: DMT family transporter [Rhodomicrobium]